jgi:hypothetical protein
MIEYAPGELLTVTPIPVLKPPAPPPPPAPVPLSPLVPPPPPPTTRYSTVLLLAGAVKTLKVLDAVNVCAFQKTPPL